MNTSKLQLSLASKVISKSISRVIAAKQIALHPVGFVLTSLDKKTIRDYTEKGYRIALPPISDLNFGVDCALLVSALGFPLELVAPSFSERPGPLASRLRRGGGYDHLCFQAVDFDAAVTSLTGMGFRPVSGRRRSRLFEEDIGFFVSKSGMIIEMVSAEKGFSPWVMLPLSMLKDDVFVGDVR